MGKAKRKGGLSGVSRFVFESMKSDSASSDAPNTSSKATPALERRDLDHGDGDMPSKRRKGNDGLVLVEEKQPLKDRWVKKYEAGGLVPHYTDISQVPEHLHKCIFTLPISVYVSLISLPRFLAALPILLVILRVTWVSSRRRRVV